MSTERPWIRLPRCCGYLMAWSKDQDRFACVVRHCEGHARNPYHTDFHQRVIFHA